MVSGMKFIPFFIKRYIERIRVIAFGEKLRNVKILGYRKTKSLLNDRKYIIFQEIYYLNTSPYYRCMI